MKVAESVRPIGSSTVLPYRRATVPIGDSLIAFLVCSVVLVFFLMTTPEGRHWFVLPVLACGCVIGADTVRVIRGKISVFDPVGFVGIIGIHFFFFAPLLHVYFDRWMKYVSSPSDWREWLGRMALLNFIGLLAYASTKTAIQRRTNNGRRKSIWRLDERRFRNTVLVALAGTAILQLWVYQRFGGILGYIRSYEEQAGEFQGYGVLFSISESFPILAMMAFVVWARDREVSKRWIFLGAILVVYLIITVFFGGLRGSRSNTIWALFWAAGLVHFWLRPIPRKVLVVGATFVIAFMYLYGFYKSLGTDAFEIATSGGGIAAVEEESGRSLEGVLLGDLGRSDVQAFLLFRLTPGPRQVDYEYAKGRSYVGGMALVIPRWIWPDRPPTKTTFGTDAQYGAGAHETRTRLSSRAYGLAGEGMLNFGPLIVPVLYGGYGLVVGLAQRWRDGLEEGDSRFLVAPFITICTFYLLVWDSDNLVFFLFKRGMLPLTVVLASSIVVRHLVEGATQKGLSRS